MLSRLSAPQSPADLDPSNDFRHIAYDAAFHLAKLPSWAQARVTALQAEAASQHGPWTVTVVPPATSQIGTQGSWTVQVRAVSGDAVPAREVHLSVTGATMAGAATVTLDANGDAHVALTPTQSSVALSAGFQGPRTIAEARASNDINTTRALFASDNDTPYAGQAAATAAPGIFAPGPQATLSGQPRVGRLLTASAGTTVPSGTATYQWLAGGSVVGTGPTYRPTLDDLGKQLQVTASISRPGYTSASSTSAATKPVRLPRTTLVVQVRSRASLGTRLLVRAAGLTPGEPCTIHLGGDTVRTCHARLRGAGAGPHPCRRCRPRASPGGGAGGRAA